MALREVNLIAADILERRFLRRHLSVWCGCLVAVIVLMTGIYGYQTRILYAPKQHPAGVKNRSAVLAEMGREITKDQRELNNALKERTQLSILTETQRSYSSIMAKLAEIMNDQTWLIQLAVDTGRDRTARLRLMGMSVSHDTLGDFIQRLSNAPLFRGVTLKSAQEAEVRIGGESRVQFQIDCDVAGR